MYIDEKTKAMWHDLNVRRKTESPHGTPWPMVKASGLLRHGDDPAYFYRWLYRHENYRQTVAAYQRDPFYAECYECLAYMVYGYGFMSNNERRHAGLKPRRIRRRR